ncbi:MAG: replication initiation factor domain-containing protein [Candidatus Methanomethylicaceae archaeon]
MKNLFFDWYACSIEASIESVIQGIWDHYPHATLELARPRNGFSHADCLVLPSGEPVCTFMYGRASQYPFVFSSGVHADGFSQVVRHVFPSHYLVRADVAMDFEEPGAYLSLFNQGIGAAESVSVSTRYVGPALHALSAECSSGRTLYLGSRSSVGMMRIYEKGKKDCPDRPDWVRVEFEFKPKNSEARRHYASASPLEMVSAMKLPRAFFEPLVDLVESASVRPGTIRRPTDQERTLEHLKKQYGRALQQLLHDLDYDAEAFVHFLVGDIV